MVKHTPGPWAVGSACWPRPDGGVTTCVYDTQCCPVALSWTGEGVPRADGELLANARLIAAAPDLLATLMAVRITVKAGAEGSHLTDGFSIGDDGLPCKRKGSKPTREDSLLQIVDAAIAKAEGRG